MGKSRGDFQGKCPEPAVYTRPLLFSITYAYILPVRVGRLYIIPVNFKDQFIVWDTACTERRVVLVYVTIYVEWCLEKPVWLA